MGSVRRAQRSGQIRRLGTSLVPASIHSGFTLRPKGVMNWFFLRRQKWSESHRPDGRIAEVGSR